MTERADDFTALFTRFLKIAYGRNVLESLDVANKMIAQIKACPELATTALDIETWGRKTPIMHLVHGIWASGAEDVLRALIENKADAIDATVITEVASRANTGALKQLIAAKADVNSATQDNWTPLMSAARFGQVDNVRVLLDAKADPSLRFSTTPSIGSRRLAGKTAWETACTDCRHLSSELQQLASLLGPVPQPAPPAPRVDLEAIASASARTSESSTKSTTVDL